MKFFKDNKNINMSEKEILRYLSLMIIPIHYLNTAQIYHMDIKLENFLVDTRNQGKIYLNLCDFSISVDKKMSHDLNMNE
jgi:serine/threonine protein kinase